MCIMTCNQCKYLMMYMFYIRLDNEYINPPQQVRIDYLNILLSYHLLVSIRIGNSLQIRSYRIYILYFITRIVNIPYNQWDMVGKCYLKFNIQFTCHKFKQHKFHLTKVQNHLHKFCI